MKKLEERHKALWKAVVPLDREAARRALEGRLKALALKHGFAYNRVVVRNQKTRWGSCSARNNISLNMKLVRLPQTMMDYVLLHELVHTCIKNHSNAFWEMLAEVIDNPKALDAELNTYVIALL